MQIIKTTEPKVLWKSNCILGEGPLWVKEHNSVYFVDIKRKNIHILNVKNKKKKIIKVNKQIGFLAHIKNNIFILGVERELRIVDLKSKKKIKSINIEKKLIKNRINDGKTDPKGRLWFGTMDNFERKIKNGSLYCLDKDLNINKIDTNYFITNGPAFLDENNFYYTDSRSRIIYKIRINKKFKIIKKKAFIKLNLENGSPDGMTLDRNNNLWVATFGGAKLLVFNKKGKLIHKVIFSAKNITNCVFGGKNNTEIFVTTAKKSISKSELQKYIFSGSLFSVKSNMRGLTQKKFILSNAKKRLIL
jgi:sugar lactone lactonase YvrE